MAGIKETKEIVALAFGIAGLLKGELKDGFQVADLLKILEGALTTEFFTKIKEGVEGAEGALGEVKDVDLFEALEFTKYVISETKKLLA